MITYKIVNAILSGVGMLLFPVQFIMNPIMGLLYLITFNILKVLIDLIWTFLSLISLIGLSYVYEKAIILRPIVSLLGIPFSIFLFIYLIFLVIDDSQEDRMFKVLVCNLFPYSWHFHLFSSCNTMVADTQEYTKLLTLLDKQQLTDARANIYIGKLKLEFFHKRFKMKEN